ncbi:MAG: HAMP domain-containing protein [Sinobacteraceae bacterium]|nr:HAMP domain-containing protein [Nevskiaceae bacterium]
MGLRQRIVLIAMFASMAIVVAIALTAGRSFGEAYGRALSSRAVAVADVLAGQINHILLLGLELDEVVGFDTECQARLAGNADLDYAFVTSLDGRLIAHNDSTLVGTQQPFVALRSSLGRHFEGVIAVRDPEGTESYAAVRTVSDRTGTPIAQVVVGYAAAAVDRELDRLYRDAVLVGGVVALVGLIALFASLSRFVTGPLGRLTDEVDALREGGAVSLRLTPQGGRGEIPVLIAGFNRLLDRLHAHEQALVEARESAQQANSAKSSFLATMSHELRTPLHAVIGMSSLLASTELNPKQTRYVDVVLKSGQALLALISQIFDYISIESGRFELKFETYSPACTTKETVHMMQGLAASKGLALSLTVAENVPRTVRGDAHRIGQILANLVGNAIKFTPSGSIMVLLSATVPQRLCWEVADTGIGIPHEMRERLFEPFTQGDASMSRAYQGSGLGLATVAHLVDAMHGVVSIEGGSNGVGTRIRVEIPYGADTEG